MLVLRCRTRSNLLALSNFLRSSLYPLPRSFLRCQSAAKDRFMTISASRYAGRTAHSPQDLLRTLRNCGLPGDICPVILCKHPEVVYYHPENTLRPKIEFLLSSGFSATIVGEILVANPQILTSSLQHRIIPCINFFKQIIPADLSGVAVLILKKRRSLVTPAMLPYFEVLRKHGLSEYGILRLLITIPEAMSGCVERFDRSVTILKGMGFDLNGSMFTHAIGILQKLTAGRVKRKLEVLRSFGWKEDEIFLAIRKQPRILMISEQKIERKMVFFRDVLHWDSSLVSRNPPMMMYAFERFRRRGVVLNMLILKGLVRRTTGLYWFTMAEKTFFTRFVKRHEKKVAGLVEAYENGRNFEGWEQGCPEKVWSKSTKNVRYA